MGVPIIILGESGTGKSCSMRNFKEGEINIINVAKKPLPFRSKIKTFNSDNYAEITEAIKSAPCKVIVIDDAQYLMANENMRLLSVKGYEKYTQMAKNFWDLFQTAINDTADDVNVYFMAHIERDSEGKERFKTVGKMLDSYSIEGMATICLKTVVRDGRYFFSTQNNGSDTVKSPMGMFEEPLIENDLKMVDEKIREYYKEEN